MKKSYRWLFLLSGALAFIMSNAFSLLLDEQMHWPIKIVVFAAISVGICSHFASLHLIALWMQRLYPGLSATRRRIIWSLAIGVPTVSILMWASEFGQQWLKGEPAAPFSMAYALAFLFQGLAIAIFIVGMSEAIYHYSLLLQSERDKENLERLNLLAQYDSLKQQINPHFLFNSLNSLSSLIGIDTAKAERFVEEMSSVYRYLLQRSREERTTLGAEIEFLGSYLHLLKTRFGEALQVKIEVPDDYLSMLIPPLTLQLLLENAVKHNEVSVERPLQFNIKVLTGQRLLVSNPLQPKIASVPSEKVGLVNIIARYRLLGYPDVEIQKTAEDFIVSLPLIQASDAV